MLFEAPAKTGVFFFHFRVLEAELEGVSSKNTRQTAVFGRYQKTGQFFVVG